MVLHFPIGGTGQVLILTDSVLSRFERHRQTRWFHREAGGQLFSDLDGHDIVVQEATGPRSADWRSRFSYRPDRLAERREIKRKHAAGLHFIGDWHTHPEGRPKPSASDLQSIAECVSASVHELNAFVMVIVGQLPWPEGIHVSLHDGTTSVELAAQDVKGSDGEPRDALEGKLT